jgi:hypothetical protein
MHESGVVYNNLKPEHILVGDEQFTQESRNKIKLIDFREAQEIIDKDGNII